MKKLPRGMTCKDSRYRIEIVSLHARPGKRYRERLPEKTTRRQAETYLAKIREADRLQTLLWPSEREQLRELPSGIDTVSTYADNSYLPFCVTRNTASTVKSKILHLQQSHPWFGDIPLGEIDASLVYRFQAERKLEGVRARTVNMEWGTIRHLLNHAHNEGLCPPPPRVAALPERDSRESRPLTEAEATRALQYAWDRDPFWYTVAITLLHTGARWGDLMGLKWDDVQLDEELVLFRAGASKQNRDREVPLMPEVIHALRGLERFGELVFYRPSKNTGELLPLWKNSRCIGGKFPWEGPGQDLSVGAHTFRHTFAAWRLRSGVGIEKVQKWLGHANIALTVDTYGHIESRDHADEIIKCPRPKIQKLKIVGE